MTVTNLSQKISYDSETQAITVKTQTGIVWQYSPVTTTMFNELLGSNNIEESIQNLIKANLIVGVRRA